MNEEYLSFHSEYHDMLIEGIKTSTIRLHSDLKPGDKFKLIRYAEGGPKTFTFKVTQVNRIRFDEIDNKLAIKEGYCHKKLLQRDLRSIYPEIINSSLLYQISFEMVK